MKLDLSFSIHVVLHPAISSISAASRNDMSQPMHMHILSFYKCQQRYKFDGAYSDVTRTEMVYVGIHDFMQPTFTINGLHSVAVWTRGHTFYFTLCRQFTF